jgi:hypothetical protein
MRSYIYMGGDVSAKKHYSALGVRGEKGGGMGEEDWEKHLKLAVVAKLRLTMEAPRRATRAKKVREAESCMLKMLAWPALFCLW